MKLNIPQPCNESWHQMTPAARGRHCASCQKTVVDFSNSTDATILAYFKSANQSVCGRFKNEQLDRPLHIEQSVHWWKFPRWMAAGIAGMFTSVISAIAAPQSSTSAFNAMEASITTEVKNTVRKHPQYRYVTLMITSEGMPIAGAQVQIAGMDSIFSTDNTGLLLLTLPWSNYHDRSILINISHPEYEDGQFQIGEHQSDATFSLMPLNIIIQRYYTAGLVTVGEVMPVRVEERERRIEPGKEHVIKNAK